MNNVELGENENSSDLEIGLHPTPILNQSKPDQVSYIKTEHFLDVFSLSTYMRVAGWPTAF